METRLRAAAALRLAFDRRRFETLREEGISTSNSRGNGMKIEKNGRRSKRERVAPWSSRTKLKKRHHPFEGVCRKSHPPGGAMGPFCVGWGGKDLVLWCSPRFQGWGSRKWRRSVTPWVPLTVVRLGAVLLREEGGRSCLDGV